MYAKRAGDVTVGRDLLNMLKDCFSPYSLKILGPVPYTCNPSTLEVTAGRSEVQNCM